MILFLLMVVEWQVVNRPYSDFEQELAVYFSISTNNLKFVSDDSAFYAKYEVQIKIFDNKKNQLTGDYWEGVTFDSDKDVSDSVMIIIPKTSRRYNLRIIDGNAGTILDVSEKIIQINYIGNIKWDMFNDTLLVAFSIINPEGDVFNMLFSIDEIEQRVNVKKGTYDDTVVFYIPALPNGDYKLNIKTLSPTKTIDEIQVPLKIARPFFLDETTWLLKVSQLEYIATTSEIDKLKEARREERNSLWFEIWKRHDPTPNTKYNEKEVEYFERIEYCEENFSHGDRGWRSDRARIYVTLGKPDEITRYPYYTAPRNPTNPAETLYDSYEVWSYYKINLQYIFGDRHGFGEYLILNPNGSSL
ncbi:MAG: GWxTD domain-containing protein [bacterium]